MGYGNKTFELGVAKTPLGGVDADVNVGAELLLLLILLLMLMLILGIGSGEESGLLFVLGATMLLLL